MFIVVEGPDGSGKTELCRRLRAKHPDWYSLSEPCRYTPLGRILRKAVDGTYALPKPAFMPLFLAARYETFSLILQTLKRDGHEALSDTTVVLDRYLPSTLVYQQGEWSQGLIAMLHAGLPRPDLCILLDAEPELLAERAGDLYVHSKNLADLTKHYRALPTIGDLQYAIGHYIAQITVGPTEGPLDILKRAEAAIERAQSCRTERVEQL